jgi:hypothetical protein
MTDILEVVYLKVQYQNTIAVDVHQNSVVALVGHAAAMIVGHSQHIAAFL